MAAKDSDSKSMDVSKPGKTSPDESARPVLVTHRPMVQDPMVHQDSGDDESTGPAIKKDGISHSTKTLQPVDSSLKRDEPAELDSAIDEVKSEEAAVIEAVAEQADNKARQKNGDLNIDEQTRQEHLQKLIADKTYFVSVGQAARERNNRVGIVLLALLVLLIVSYLAVDAQVIKNNIKLPYEFVKATPKIEPVAPAVLPQSQPTVPRYVSKQDKLNFTYPNTWKVTKATNSPEHAQLDPVKPIDSTNHPAIQFDRLVSSDVPTSVLGRTIAKIEYTDITASLAPKLYVRKVIYLEVVGKLNFYGVSFSVADKKGEEKVGDKITDFDTQFLAADGKTKLLFTASSGTTTISDLSLFEVNIAKNKDFTEARNILMSLKLK